MESDEVRELLEVAERAEAAPYIDYPTTPWWYPPVVGAWVAAMIGTFTWWRENIGLFVGSMVVLVIVEVVFLGWMTRRHGAFPMPGKGTPPAEIRSAWNSYFAALPPIAGLIGLSWWLGGVPIAAAVAFVVVTAGLVIYERRYAKAACVVRARLT